MSLPFTPQQCFFAAIIVFAIVGLQRGWRRELITVAFVSAGLIFLLFLNGGPGLAHFIFVRIPAIIADILGQPAPSTSEPSLQTVQITTVLAFIAVLALSYVVGNRMPKPATPADRIWGIGAGILTGFLVVLFINHFFNGNQGGNSLFTLAIETPDPSNYIGLLLVIAVVIVVVALIATRVKKSGGAKK